MNEIEKFKKEVKERVTSYADKSRLQKTAHDFMEQSIIENYSYNFSWLGRPIIQYPQDILALQEIIWKCKPDLIIETGIAHGGSLIFNASMLKLIHKRALVLGIDIDVRKHNREEIENHFLYKEGWIRMIEGSSIDDDIVKNVHQVAKGYENIMLILDSNHTHEHVLAELRAYAGLVTKGQYLVVLDTMVEDFEDRWFEGKKWGKGDNPKTAVHEFLKENEAFEIDSDFNNKLLISVAPDGYLKRIPKYD